MPGGDDKIVGNFHYLGENVDLPNSIYFPVLLWKDVSALPYTGNKIFMRIFDSNNLTGADWYGDAQIYEIQSDNIQEYYPVILEVNSLNSNNVDLLAGISQDELNYHLYANYPNPFNPTTKIRYTIMSNEKREMSNVSLKIYDVLGKEVATLVNEEQPAGEYEVEFDGSNNSSGIYFYRIQSGDFVKMKRMLLLK
ncbi:MAG: hypothetical protein DRQ13_11235 [Ignavibacteriae bacterium]|nr:MAG: hypothetical protein DRQ13_11235 [Ignavibacteriota bacterium]